MSGGSLGHSPPGQSGCDGALLWRLQRGGERHAQVILVPSLTHCRHHPNRLLAKKSGLFRRCGSFPFYLRGCFEHSTTLSKVNIRLGPLQSGCAYVQKLSFPMGHTYIHKNYFIWFTFQIFIWLLQKHKLNNIYSTLYLNVLLLLSITPTCVSNEYCCFCSKHNTMCTETSIWIYILWMQMYLACSQALKMLFMSVVHWIFLVWCKLQSNTANLMADHNCFEIHKNATQQWNLMFSCVGKNPSAKILVPLIGQQMNAARGNYSKLTWR